MAGKKIKTVTLKKTFLDYAASTLGKDAIDILIESNLMKNGNKITGIKRAGSDLVITYEVGKRVSKK